MSVEPKKDFKHIVRVANVDLPGTKSIRYALTNIRGIGVTLSDAILSISSVPRTTKAGELTDQQLVKINETIAHLEKAGLPTWMFNRRKDYETGENKHLITSSLSFTQENDLKRLKKIKSLRGIRHIRGLPVRGQRTRSNFRRSKGKVVGVAKKK
ncbi:30S ribosomal protein S13 [Candidatus Woesearchaeota archaeon]|nr:30S ribosomal protein S13 [Candidatus Woesearchaeota archaeon]